MAEKRGEREDENRQKPHQSRVIWKLPGFVLVFSQVQPRRYTNQNIVSTAIMARAKQNN